MRTFADHGEDFGFFAHCPHCVRDRRYTREEIAERFGLDADVHEVRKRLRCSACGKRDALLYRYYRGGMHGPSEGAYQIGARKDGGDQ